MFERYTDVARMTMAVANQQAQRFYNEYIGTEHILLGITKVERGLGYTLVQRMERDGSKVRLEVQKLVKSGADPVSWGFLPLTPRAKKVIEYSLEEACGLNHNYIGSEHLLLGLLRERDGDAGKLLTTLGLVLEKVRETIVEITDAGINAGRTGTPDDWDD